MFPFLSWSTIKVCSFMVQFILQALEEIQDLCKDMGIPHMVLLKDTDNVKIRSFDKEKGSIVESRVISDKVVETLQQRLCKM